MATEITRYLNDPTGTAVLIVCAVGCVIALAWLLTQGEQG